MSRSYKHYPVCTSGTNSFAKSYANRSFRRIGDPYSENLLKGKSNLYRRYYQSWNICDYKKYGGRLFRKESWWYIPIYSKLWEKWYRRK